jgi:hypothetical protein
LGIEASQYVVLARFAAVVLDADHCVREVGRFSSGLEAAHFDEPDVAPHGFEFGVLLYRFVLLDFQDFYHAIEPNREYSVYTLLNSVLYFSCLAVLSFMYVPYLLPKSWI